MKCLSIRLVLVIAVVSLAGCPKSELETHDDSVETTDSQHDDDAHADAHADARADTDTHGPTANWLKIHLYGPPDNFPELDPFDGCTKISICHELEGNSTPLGCDSHPPGNSPYQPALPDGEMLSVTVQCLGEGPLGDETVLSTGRTLTLEHSPSDQVMTTTVYMLPPLRLGPTATANPETPFGSGLPTQPLGERAGAAAVELYDHSILIAGGFSKLAQGCNDPTHEACLANIHETAERYRPDTGDFTPVGDAGPKLMTEKRAFPTAVKLPSEEVAIFGGINGDGVPCSTVDIYDPISQTFAAGQPMGAARAFHTATLISAEEGSLVLLVGGQGDGENSYEMWTPEQGTILMGDLHESRRLHTATLVSKQEDPNVARNMVVIAGGETGPPDSSNVRSTMEIFNIDTLSLDASAYPLCSNQSEQSPTPAKKTMHAAAFVPYRHFIYIGGGFKDGKHETAAKDICVWHTAKEKWAGEAGTFMLKWPRGGLTATALAGNAVLFAGGRATQDGKPTTPPSIELVFEYNNDKGETVVDIGPGSEFPIPMVWPRWTHKAIPTDDGRILFFGGLAGAEGTPEPIFNTEVFNPAQP